MNNPNNNYNRRRPSGGAAGRSPSATKPRPPVTSPSAGGRAPNGARRAPAPFGTSPRPGIRSATPVAKPRGRASSYLIAALVVVLIIVILLVAIPKTANSPSKAGDVPESAPAVETEAESEPPETEAPAKSYAFAVRDASTVQLGDTIKCDHAILIDVDEGKIVAEKGGDDVIYPASMTKVLTSLVAVEKCENLDDTFTMTNEIVGNMYEANASVAGFAPGEEVTVRDLVYGSLLPSGGDGTIGLAEYTAGSEAAFSELMNEKCAELGLKSSHFTTASGLHADDHYSTCHEIALIMEAAMDNETVASALGTAEYLTEKTPQHPDGIELHHTLLYERLDGSEEFDGKIVVIGGKTGYTGEAGNCLVTMARVASTGKRYIFVCAGGDSKWEPVYDTIHVYRNYLGVEYDGEYVPKYLR